jgi:hypothetical protein
MELSPQASLWLAVGCFPRTSGCCSRRQPSQGMGLQRFTEWYMDHRSTANTGDWANGEWCSGERKARLLSTTARIQRPRADWNTWEEIEAKEAEKRPRQDFSSFWNARSQKHRNKKTKLEVWLEERDSNARREKYAGIACVDDWLRRYPDPAKTITEHRSQRVAALPETAKGITNGPKHVVRRPVHSSLQRAG